jgi:hypothetical protein
MITTCSICGAKLQWAGWMEAYPQLKPNMPVRDLKGNLCHKTCLKFYEKDLFNKAAGVPVEGWKPADFECLSSSAINKVKKGRYKNYVEEWENK